jgi:hypothetical protein
MKFKINIIKKRVRVLKEATSTSARGLYNEDPLGLVDDLYPDIKASTEPSPGIDYGDPVAAAAAIAPNPPAPAVVPAVAPAVVPAVVPAVAPETTAPATTADRTKGLVNINQVEGLNIRTSRNRQYGTAEMRDYLKSLGNVAGGNYYVGDLSSEHGGKLGGHKSHQSGIDADISIPTTGDGHGVNVSQNGRWGFRSVSKNIDYNRTLSFLRHSAPYSKQIFLDKRFYPELKRLAQEKVNAKTMKQGEYNRLFVNKRGQRRIVQHVKGHHNHFHVRLNTPGLNDPRSAGKHKGHKHGEHGS